MCTGGEVRPERDEERPGVLISGRKRQSGNRCAVNTHGQAAGLHVICGRRIAGESNGSEDIEGARGGLRGVPKGVAVLLVVEDEEGARNEVIVRRCARGEQSAENCRSRFDAPRAAPAEEGRVRFESPIGSPFSVSAIERRRATAGVLRAVSFTEMAASA